MGECAVEHYKKILVACELGGEVESVMQRATHVAANNQAELYLLHVHEPIIIDPAFEFSPVISADVEKGLLDAAEQALQRLASRYTVPAENVMFEIGSPGLSIVQVARGLGADLIIVGSHGRHGVQLLLGSTANAVLHRSTCDVLAVRMPVTSDIGE